MPKLMSKQDFITEHFQASAQSILANQHLAEIIERSAQLIYQSFQSGGKLLICGNGGSAADAQHLSSELLNRYHRERPELPGIALTGNSANILNAVKAAHDKSVKCVALNGKSGGKLSPVLAETGR